MKIQNEIWTFEIFRILLRMSDINVWFETFTSFQFKKEVLFLQDFLDHTKTSFFCDLISLFYQIRIFEISQLKAVLSVILKFIWPLRFQMNKLFHLVHSEHFNIKTLHIVCVSTLHSKYTEKMQIDSMQSSFLVWGILCMAGG